jgi:hypothetical protein
VKSAATLLAFGVGSVGTRAYLVLLFGNGDDDPLFLQVKESVMAAPAPYLPPLPKEYRHNGKRVVAGQRALQASSDPNAGLDLDQWPRLLRAPDEEPKGIDPGGMADRRIVQLLRLGCGAILARAHSRTGDPAPIAGYCGNSTVLDEALAEWAESYGDQTERDHSVLVKAIQNGEIKAQVQADEG